MFYNLRRRINYAWLNHRIRGIASTPPLSQQPDADFVLVSQICHRDIWLYLLALKSFTRFLQPTKIYVVDDMSLTPEDHATLKHHIPDIHIEPQDTIKTNHCPKGGCWERLLFIGKIVVDTYVVQLDCDTLTLQYPEEVAQCIKEGCAFTQGTLMGREVVAMKDFAEEAGARLNEESSHVQILAEGQFSHLKNIDSLKYIRGCAGFAGFPKGANIHERAEAFSVEIEALLGDKWHDWGSEQVTSNFVIANSNSPTVLPYETYSVNRTDEEAKDSRLIHFIGPYRFRGGAYAKLGIGIIRALRQHQDAN